MKKALVAIILMCFSGCLFADERQEKIKALPEAYRELGQKCLEAVSFNCCMSSVNNMVSARAILKEDGKDCPSGYVFDTLKCEDSYAWCEPVKALGENR